jgi:hypothetical protein
MCDSIANGGPRAVACPPCPPANVIIASNVLDTTGNVIAGNIIAVDGTFTGNLYVAGNIVSNISYSILNVAGSINGSSIWGTSFFGNGYGLSNINASNINGTISNTNLPPSGVVAGTYGSSANVSQVTVDQYGLVTAASNIGILSSQWTTVAGNVAYQNGVSVGTLNAPPVGSNLYVLGSANITDTLNVSTLYVNSATVFGSATLNVFGISNLNSVLASLYIGNGSGISNLNSSNLVGNVAAANVASSVTSPAQLNITSVGQLTSLIVSGLLVASNGSGISNLNSSNLVGNVANANVALVVSQPAQPNITSLGVLNSLNVQGLLIVSNGSGISNINSSNLVGNVAAANVAGVVTNPSQPNITSVGTLTGLSVQGLLIVSNGSAISNLNSSNLVGNVASANTALVVSQASQPNITSVGTLTSLVVSGILNSNLFTGNGSGISNLNSSNLVGNVANANVALVVSQASQPNVTSLGVLNSLNVQGLLIVSNGSGISNLNSSNLVGNVASANVAMVVSQPSQPNITSVGTLTSLIVSGVLQASLLTGNASGISNLNSSNLVGNVANANVALVVSQASQPNITSVGTLTSLTVSGSSNAAIFYGSGAGLTNVPVSNLSGTVNFANTAGSVVNPAQPNITSVGALTTLTVIGSLIAGTISGDGQGLYGIHSNSIVDTVATANSVVQPAQPNITSVGTLTGLGVQGLLIVSNASGISNINASNLAFGTLSTGVFPMSGVTSGMYGSGANVSQVTVDQYGRVTAAANVATQWTTVAGNVAYQNGVSIGTLSAPPTGSNLYVLGTATIGNVISNGSALSALQASNVQGSVPLANVVALASQPNITSVGTTSTTFTVNGLLIAANASGLSNVNGANVSTVPTAQSVIAPAQTNITSVGTLTGLSVQGLLIVSNGSAISNLNSSNLVGNVASANTALVVTQASQPNITSVGTSSTTFTVSGLLIASNGSGISNLNSSNLVGNVANSNVALVVSQASQPNITSVGTLTGLNVQGLLIVSNGSAISNLNSSNLVGNVANANVALVVSQASQPNITIVGTVSTTFTVNGILIASNGSGISNLNSSNLVGNVANANVALVISQASQPNITSVGTLTGLTINGLLIASNGSGISNLNSSNLVGNVANANVAMVVSQPSQPNITSVGTLTGLTVQGLLIVSNGSGISNLNSSNLVGNVAAANVATSVTSPAQPNITSVGTLTSLAVSGVIQSGLFTGNASGLSNVNGANVSTVPTSGVVTDPFQPNITSVGTLTGLYSSGNITATFFTGQGNGLTNVLSSVLVGNVANANVALVVSQASQPNITSVGTLTSLTVSGVLNASLITGNGSGISNLNSSNLVGNVANANVALVVSQASQPNVTSLGVLNSLNVQGLLIVSNGSGISNLNSSNLVGNVANANVALVVSQASQPNITSVGTLTGLNVQGLLIVSNGSGISNLNSSNLVGNVANANVALVVSQPSQPNITSVGTLTGLSVQGLLIVSNGSGISNLNSSNLVGNVANANVALVVSQASQSNITSVGTLTGLTINGLLIASNGSGISNLNSSNLVGNVANANVALVVSQPSQPNITSVGTLNALTTGNLTVTSNILPGAPTGNTYLTGNLVVSGNVFSALGVPLGSGGGYYFSLPGDIALQTPYTGAVYGVTYPLSVGLSNGFTISGTSTLITVTPNGNFKFGVAGPYLLRAVFNSSDNIKGLAVGSNVADVHGTDQGYMYRYTTFITQNPTELIEIPFNVTDVSKYYYLDLFSVDGGSLHQTANTSGGTYLTITPLQGGGLASGGPGGTPGTQWISSGSNIYYSNSVGIGAVNPTYALTVTGQGYFSQEVSYDNFAGFRNRLINGTFRVASRSNTLTVSNTSTFSVSNAFVVDRWFVDSGNLSTSNVAMTIKQDAPIGETNGFSNVANVFVTRAFGVTTDNTWFCPLVQTVEASGTYDLRFGQATAKPMVLSFYANAAVTGNYSVVLRSKADNTYYANLVTLTNSWNRYTVYAPACTIGTWGTGLNGSVEVCLFGVSFGSGRANVAPTVSWTASPGYAPVACTGAVNWMTTAPSRIQVTGVQLELGTLATPFEVRLLSETVRLCQRYYETNPDIQYAAALGSGRVNSVPFVVTKRNHANVTVFRDLSNLTANTNVSQFVAYYGDGALKGTQAVNSYLSSDYGFSFNFTNTGSKFMDASIMEAQFVWQADAEIY